MQELVFIESDDLNCEPFTKSSVVAGYAEIEPRAVRQLIRKYEVDLKEFGILTFEMSKINPGRGRKSKDYHLNQQQTTLLITYLDNTESVRKFKKELVHQFFAMETELAIRRLERTKGKTIRLSMTDAIKQAGFSSHFYKHFTDLVYKKALGFNAKQLREARGAKPKATPLDFLTIKEQAAVNQIEELVTGLIRLGRSYDDIKLILNVGVVIYQTTLKTPETAR